MSTFGRRGRDLVGVSSVFPLPPAGAGGVRPVGVGRLLTAVRAVNGVLDAELRTAAGGDRTLHLELVDGADEATVAWSVTRILDERLGVDVDPTGSVLVDDDEDEARSAPLEGPQRRVHLERLQVVTGGLDVRVDVALATATARVVGSSSGPAVERTVLRTVAGATLNAVDALLEGQGRCGLDQAELSDIGSDRVAVAVVTLLTSGHVDRLAGAALVRGDARQAMVRAVLGALNRRFETLLPEGGAPAWTRPSFPLSAPLAVENTATFRTISAPGDLLRPGPRSRFEEEPDDAGGGYGTEATDDEHYGMLDAYSADLGPADQGGYQSGSARDPIDDLLGPIPPELLAPMGPSERDNGRRSERTPESSQAQPDPQDDRDGWNRPWPAEDAEPAAEEAFRGQPAQSWQDATEMPFPELGPARPDAGRPEPARPEPARADSQPESPVNGRSHQLPDLPPEPATGGWAEATWARLTDEDQQTGGGYPAAGPPEPAPAPFMPPEPVWAWPSTEPAGPVEPAGGSAGFTERPSGAFARPSNGFTDAPSGSFAELPRSYAQPSGSFPLPPAAGPSATAAPAGPPATSATDQALSRRAAAGDPSRPVYPPTAPGPEIWPSTGRSAQSTGGGSHAAGSSAQYGPAARPVSAQPVSAQPVSAQPVSAQPGRPPQGYPSHGPAQQGAAQQGPPQQVPAQQGPVQTGLPPAQTGLPPAQSGLAPAQSGLAPAQSGLPPAGMARPGPGGAPLGAPPGTQFPGRSTSGGLGAPAGSAGLSGQPGRTPDGLPRSNGYVPGYLEREYGSLGPPLGPPPGAQPAPASRPDPLFDPSRALGLPPWADGRPLGAPLPRTAGDPLGPPAPRTPAPDERPRDAGGGPRDTGGISHGRRNGAYSDGWQAEPLTGERQGGAGRADSGALSRSDYLPSGYGGPNPGYSDPSYPDPTYRETSYRDASYGDRPEDRRPPDEHRPPLRPRHRYADEVEPPRHGR